MTAMSSSHWLQSVRRQRQLAQRVMHRLTLSEICSTGAEVVNARWQLRACDRVGALTRAQGRLYVRNEGVIHVGDWCLFESTVTPIALLVHPGASLTIGSRSYFNFGVCLESRGEVIIGPRCHLGQYVQIMDNDQHDVVNHRFRPESHPVVLEEGVWLGARCIVLKGVTIGRGTTVGAGSVVTRSLPPRCIAAGAPAKVIRYLDA